MVTKRTAHCSNKAGQKIKIFDFLTVHLGKYAAHTYKSDKDKKN